MNKVILTGHAGREAETKFLSNNNSVTTFTLATNEYLGQDKKVTSWHNIVIWGTYGEKIGKLITSGTNIGIEGRINYESYEKDGVTRYRTTIIAEKVEVYSNKSDSNRPSVPNTRNEPVNNEFPEPVNAGGMPSYQSSSTSAPDDDLPF